MVNHFNYVHRGLTPSFIRKQTLCVTPPSTKHEERDFASCFSCRQLSACHMSKTRNAPHISAFLVFGISPPSLVPNAKRENAPYAARFLASATILPIPLTQPPLLHQPNMRNATQSHVSRVNARPPPLLSPPLCPNTRNATLCRITESRFSCCRPPLPYPNTQSMP